eukprot:5658997-Prymnesium_polylepis.1
MFDEHKVAVGVDHVVSGVRFPFPQDAFIDKVIGSRVGDDFLQALSNLSSFEQGVQKWFAVDDPHARVSAMPTPAQR